MPRSKITNFRALQLAERYGAVEPGRYEVPCHWCEVPTVFTIAPTIRKGLLIERWISRQSAEIDHLIACHVGGTNDLDNLVFACSPCNSSRGHKHWTPPRLARK